MGYRLVRRAGRAPPSSGTGRAMPWASSPCALVERYDLLRLPGRALYSLAAHQLLDPAPRRRRRSSSSAPSSTRSRRVTSRSPATAATTSSSNRLAMGHNLEEVYQESVARLDFVRKAGFVDVQDIILHLPALRAAAARALALVRHAERGGLRRAGLRGRADARAHEHHAVLVLDHQAAVALHVRRLRGGARGGGQGRRAHLVLAGPSSSCWTSTSTAR